MAHANMSLHPQAPLPSLDISQPQQTHLLPGKQHGNLTFQPQLL